MMKKVPKFPLKMKNGVNVRTIEELRENADFESIITYYLSGQLGLWCKAFNYDELYETLNEVKEDLIIDIYSKLEIPFDKKKLAKYLKDNNSFAKEEKIEQPEINDEVIKDDKTIKSKLENYIDGNINLKEYNIQITDSTNSTQNEVRIMNIKSKQTYSFLSPTKFDEKLYSKISDIIKFMEKPDGDIKLDKAFLSQLRIRESFKMGRYNNRPISWIVIEKNNMYIEAISADVICNRVWDKARTRGKMFMSGSNFTICELKKWLSTTFYEGVFDDYEKSVIYIPNTFSIGGLSLLSKEEYDKLGISDLIVNDDWWLQSISPKTDDRRNLYVYAVRGNDASGLDDINFSDALEPKPGEVYETLVDSNLGVRPVLRISYKPLV